MWDGGFEGVFGGEDDVYDVFDDFVWCGCVWGDVDDDVVGGELIVGGDEFVVGEFVGDGVGVGV